MLVDVITRTEKWLRQKGVDSPRLDTELILCKVLGMERLQLYLAHDRPMSQAELEELRGLVKRRGDREPLAWVTGKKGFHAIELAVGPGVLVPRPDTETLVNAALEWIGDEDPTYIADIGCGSGAIGLAIAHERPGVRVFATDVSEQALAYTKANVAALGLEKRVAVLNGNLLDPIPDQRPVDWVLSNPPYIPTTGIDTLQPEVSRHEPRLALDGGEDGLDVYRQLLPAAAGRDRRGVLVEVGHDQAARVVDLFNKAGLTSTTTWKDLDGIVRVVGARRG
jgi:release factor glutamine methyltransferase